MSLGLFIIFVSVFTPLIVWAIKNEDRLIDLEDKIIADIKDSRTQTNREKNIHIVENKQDYKVRQRIEVHCEERNFVA